MNSPFALMFIEISDRLKTMVPDLRYINQDIGQLEYYESRPSVSFPCVLIDFEGFTFTEEGELSQIAEGDVKIRLAHAPFSDASNLVPDVVRDKALTYYDIEWLVFKALHGWQGDSFGALMRKSANTEKREDNYRVREIVFSTSFQDNSAGNNYQPVLDDARMVIQSLDGNVITDNGNAFGQS